MDRHSISRRARLFAVTCFVVLLTPLLPVAASGLGHGVQPTRVDRGAEHAAAAWSRPVPADPRISARHEIAEAQLLAQRAADQARAAQAHAAAVKAAAAAKARAAVLAATKARVARERHAASVARQRTVARTASYGGRNRMWYPALGMSYSVSWFPCSRSRAPDNYVYRWGCAGSNNVYLMAHAWGKFNPLYRAYYSGRLSRGQLLVYADNSGRIHRFRLSWWRTYPPLTSASWAWASLSRSSATLQTCVGPNSSLRLFVRFVEV